MQELIDIIQELEPVQTAHEPVPVPAPIQRPAETLQSQSSQNPLLYGAASFIPSAAAGGAAAAPYPQDALVANHIPFALFGACHPVPLMTETARLSIQLVRMERLVPSTIQLRECYTQEAAQLEERRFSQLQAAQQADEAGINRYFDNLHSQLIQRV